jgi:hypothetical protein
VNSQAIRLGSFDQKDFYEDDDEMESDLFSLGRLGGRGVISINWPDVEQILVPPSKSVSPSECSEHEFDRCENEVVIAVAEIHAENDKESDESNNTAVNARLKMKNVRASRKSPRDLSSHPYGRKK